MIDDKEIYNLNNCYKLFDKLDMKTVKKNHVEYLNVAVSFDIESSSFYDTDSLSKVAVMYIWQICFSGGIIIGRTWEEFINTLYMIRGYYGLNENKRLVVFVHNLEFEFQYLRRWLRWSSVFALEERKVVKAVTDFGIEFRCSYILTNKSLQKVAEDLPEEYNGIAKLKGDLDYTLIRSPETPITDEELQYCINDVLIVVYLIYDKLKNENNIANIPLTATGYVRKAVRRNCLYNKIDYGKSWYYKRLISGLTLTVDDYKMLKLCFQGGFTHASALMSGRTVTNVGSIDLVSAYPGEAIKEKYPMSPFKDVKVKNREEFNMYIDRFACLFYIELFNLESSEIYEHIISESRCIACDNPVIDNGRVVSADRVLMVINEVDYKIISKFYTWSKMRIGRFKTAYKQYLPQLLVESILNFYQLKTELKGIKGRERDLALAKSNLNSCYGMMVTDICRDDVVYQNDEWDVDNADYDKKIEEYNKSKSRFLFYPWGIWITSYCRSTILTAIHDEFKTDYLYSDTDSIKFKNVDAHKDFITRFNEDITEQVKTAIDKQRLPLSMVAPENKNGVKKHIAFFELEHVYNRFKTLGAKRYLTEIDGELSLTCSGLNSYTATEYIASQSDPFTFFSDNMYIPEDYTGKLTHTYLDYELQGIATDYRGQTFRYYEKSAVHLAKQNYSLSIGFAYSQFLKGVKTYYETI